MSRHTNLSNFEPLVRLVTTAGTPVRLSPYQVASTIAFNNNSSTGAADTITDSGSGFLTAGFSVGDSLTVAGSTNNNTTTGKNLVIASIIAGTITLEKIGVLTLGNHHRQLFL